MDKNIFFLSTAFQTMTWMRIIGGSLFLIGGVIPIVYWVTKGMAATKDQDPPLPLVEEEPEKVLVK